MPMSNQDARNVERVEIVVGSQYPFFCEMQQEYEPPAKRMRNYTGQLVTVIAEEHTPRTNTGWTDEDSTLYTVRAKDGFEFSAQEEELNDWDRDLGQYFWPDATYGPEHDTFALVNEKE
jgi:hypothetical protein